MAGKIARHVYLQNTITRAPAKGTGLSAHTPPQGRAAMASAGYPLQSLAQSVTRCFFCSRVKDQQPLFNVSGSAASANLLFRSRKALRWLVVASLSISPLHIMNPKPNRQVTHQQTGHL